MTRDSLLYLLNFLESVWQYALGGSAVVAFAVRTILKKRRSQQNAQHEKKIYALLRAFLDRNLPSLHKRLVDRGFVEKPKELDDIREYLNSVITSLKKANAYYVSIDAEIVPEQPVLTPDGNSPIPSFEIRRVRQTIRQITDSRSGGFGATPQLVLLSKKSKVVRNLVTFLSKSKQPLVLLGDPGTGKSMTMREVGRVLAEQELKKVYPSVIIFIQLSKWQLRTRKNIDVNAVDELVSKELTGSMRSRYSELKKRGRLVILFDGIDELPRDRYDQLLDALSSFGSNNVESIKTLYSCRINDFSPRFVYKQLVLLPFTPAQTTAYFRESLPPTLPVDKHILTPDDIINLLPKQRSIAQITNPLILYLIRSYLLTKKSWPASRHELFDEYFRNRYGKAFDGSSTDIGFDSARIVWEEIAYDVAIANQGASIDISQVKHANAAVAVEEGIRTGVLEKENPNDVIVRFSHHRFQEYFAAQYLARHNQSDLDWLQRLDEPRWQETILNLASMVAVSPGISTLHESIIALTKGQLMRGSSQQLAADRVDLASRIVGEVGLMEGGAGELLYRPTVAAIEKLLREGNPSTQVKMLSACKNIESLNYYRAAELVLTSPVRWVRNQALIVAAEHDSLKTGISAEFVAQINYDVVLSRFASRLPTYFAALRSTRSRILRNYIAAASIALVFSVVMAVATIVCFYQVSRLVYSTATGVGYYSRSSSSAGSLNFDKRTKDEDEGMFDEAAPANRDVGGDRLENSLESSGSSSSEAEVMADEGIFGQFGTLSVVCILAVVAVGALFYLLIRWEMEVELSILIAGSFVIALAFTADQLVRANILAVVPIGEVWLLIGVPICVVMAAAIRISSVWTYVMGTRVFGERSGKIGDLIKRTFEESQSGQTIDVAWKFTRKYWMGVTFAVTFLGGWLFGASIENINVIWITVVLCGTWLVVWGVVRRTFIKVLLKAIWNKGVKMISIYVGGVVLAMGSLLGIGYLIWKAGEKYPEESRLAGVILASILLIACLAFTLYVFLYGYLRRLYWANIVDFSSRDRWIDTIKRSGAELQAELLEHFDHQSLRLDRERYFAVIEQAEPFIAREPALSSYWWLRYKIDAIRRQQRGQD